MATPTLTLINAGSGTLTDGFVGTNADAENITGWFDFDTLETDIKVEGSNSIAGTGRANNEDMYYDDGGAAITAAGKVFRGWFNTVNTPYMGTLAGSNPYEMLISDGTNTVRQAMLGSDTYEGGWVYAFQDMDLATTANGWTGTTPTLANIDRWGWTTGHDTTAKNVDNCWTDAYRYLDGYYFTGGTSGDKVTISDVFTADMGGATPKAYGIVQRSRGIYFATGTIQIGNGATTTWFEMDGDIVQFLDTLGDLSITAGLYEISATGSGCDCVITGSVIRGPATGDPTRVYYDFSDTNHALTFTNNLIVDAGTVQFASGQTATGNTFDDCGQITHAGADMDDCTIKNYEGTAGTAALVYNVNADPDGEMDGMTFEKGTAATHAIEFGSNTPSSVTLRNQTYTGYNASNGQNDSTFYNNTGGALTINLDGASGNATYRNGSGASTTIASDPVTTTITVKDGVSLANIQNARVYMMASDATGDLPYQESVTITSSGTTATVAHTGHGMASGDFALIEGADQQNYNGCYEITVTGVDAYTYTMPGSATSPATGTITSTGGYFNSLTNASGQVTDSRSITNDQPLAGVARKSSAADDPKYKTGTLVGTVDNATGLSITTFLSRDQ